MKSVLDETEFELFAKVYRIDEAPNFQDKFYAPQLKQTMAQNAAISEDELETKLKPIRNNLREENSPITRQQNLNRLE